MDRALVGAHKVLTESLGLIKGDALAILCDERTEPAARVLLVEAESLSLHASLRLVPIAAQVEYSQTPQAPAHLAEREDFADVRGVLTCFTDLSTTTRFRRDLVRLGTDRGRRLGHIPGLTVELLARVGEVDHRAMARVAEDLALALALGDRAELSTYVFDDGGQILETHTLTCRLGGLDRPPITSTGVIPLDTWGNIPGGETFIAPLEDTAEGTFALNGSFRHHVLSAAAPLILTFANGRLRSIAGPEEERQRLRALLALRSDSPVDGDLQLAELGIGLNESLTTLTGHSLLDEKCAGTAHIAVGDNSRYGGNLQSPLHEDLVTMRPSLQVDGKPILSRGEVAFQSGQWRESLADAVATAVFEDRSLVLARTPILTYVDPSGRLCVRREVAAGRMCIYSIGTTEASRTLASILSMIPPLPHAVRAGDLVSRAQQELSLDVGHVLAALAILCRHRVLHGRNREPHP